MSSAQIATSNMASSKDDFVQFVRHTRDQRVIFYRLKVLQDPERARACGSGAKSSADRRPVDPPPIVQLKVSEGSPENDVTASYPANFFIFVSIEHAEPVGQNGGGQQQQQPVLTGTNVCSMSFLDRPSPAGYFVFPDISVRHEGKYRLIFDLYEDAHEPSIMDINFRPHPSFGDSPPLVKVMEIKSAAFEVFSAKKFPGLMTSTALSRTFAEQGVRVRIRRDVRMRRRDAKGGAPDHDDDVSRERGRVSATPEAYAKMERHRSVSIAASPSSLSRRPSMDEMNQAYAPSPIAPNTPNGMYPPQMSAWQAPAAPQPQNTFMQPPAPPAYSQQQSYAPSYPSGQQNTFMAPQYPAGNPSAHSRNASREIPLPPSGPSQHMAVPAPQYNQAGQPQSPYPTASYNRQMTHGPHLQPISTSMQHHQVAEISPNAAYANGAPLQSPIRPSHAMYGHMSQPMSAMSPRQHSFSQQSQPQQMQQIPQAHNYPQYAPIAPPRLEHAPQASGATKRTFSATFDAEHLDARLQHGERPISPVQDSKYQYQSMAPIAPPRIQTMESANDQSSFDLQMTYRRADGTQKKRPMPPGL